MSQKAYAQAGVDIDLADSLLEEVKPLLKKAVRPESLGSIGGFGGLFDISKLKVKNPVLVSSTDGVGTKVKVAAQARLYRGLGHDIVNHCSNDIAVCGAEPLYFLDYYATSKLEGEAYVGILKSLAEACREGNVALVGGETAEMPGVYGPGEFDLVGTIVGVVDKKKILTGSTIRPGDVLVGLASTGLHTNGFSLARRILFNNLGLKVDSPLPGTKLTLGEALLAPHRNYAPLLLQLQKTLNKATTSKVRAGNGLLGAAHITGSGIPGNLPRVLPAKVDAVVRASAWTRPAIFNLLADKGGVSFEELHEVFNMGIGLILVLTPEAAPKALAAAKKAGYPGWVIGEITKGTGQVRLQA